MKKSLPSLIAIFLFLISAICGNAAEFRAFWVDAWHAGFKTPEQTTAMVNYAKACNCNAVIVEMEKAGDAYHPSSYFPWAADANPSYDALADIINKAHAQNIEVHAWYCVYRIWTQTVPPPQPNHVYNLHPEWLSETSTGVKLSGTSSYLDPGVPAVQDWLVNAYLEVVQNYDIDGITFDRIRYPGTDWGYNPIAVERFNKEFGTTGKPNAGNDDWSNWRRAQISAFVKKFYCNAMAIKPQLKVGAAVWKTSLTGSRDYLQDWDAWMAGHYADYMCPMNYTTDNAVWRSNNQDNLLHAYGRHMYVAQDTCSNTVSNTNYQLKDGRSTGLLGLSLYSYNCAVGTTLQSVLTDPSTGAFPTWVEPTPMTWKTNPTYGILKGTVTDSSNGTVLYKATVSISGAGLSTTSDGTGFYGILDVSPGTYTVTCSADGYVSQSATGVTITAGAVTTRNFSLAPDGVPPVLSNIQATNIQATNAIIVWNTDENATTQVEYGPTPSYGYITPENTKLVTSHSVQLVGLAPNTQYYYRVISKDGSGSTAVSTPQTFTTIGYDIPADIIKDNDDTTGVVFVGSWIRSTSSTERYGASYHYCSGYDQSRKCTWYPNVITAGRYNVYAWWVDGANRTTHAPYFIQWSGGSMSISVNQQDPNSGGKWQLLVANVPFATGTANGWVRLSSAGVETSLNVIADAIKLEFAEDRVPPSVPTNLSAQAVSTSRIDLTWTASTDNVGVAGYKIYRNGGLIGTSTTTSFSDTNLAANTSYTYSVSAYDAESNDSGQCAPISRFTLPIAPSSGSVTCNKSVNTWYSSTTFVFNSTESFGPGTRQYYRIHWDTQPTHTWTGGEEHWSSGALELSCEDSGSYYLHLQSCNGDGIPNGTLDLGPYKYDATAPEMGAVSDDGAYTNAAGQLNATWSGSDPESGIEEYQYAVGTSPDNLGSVVPWTSAGTSTSVTTTGINLTSGVTYYIGVKARNAANAWSAVSVSDGIMAADVVEKISDAKALPNGRAVIIPQKVVSADFDSYFYIAEPLAAPEIPQYGGIRVNGTAPDQGTKVDIGGIISLINGERVITNASITPNGVASIPGPLLLINLALGGGELNPYTPGVTGGFGTNNIGMLVTVTGKVNNPPGTGFFYIDDGSLPGGVKINSEKLNTKIPAQGDYVVVTGISSTEVVGGTVYRVVIPRGDSDVTIYH
ncbi:MAG: family 10 glycosylhydrolase [Armatimonadota bacterium]|nr:family 10 glycosylhydrolase [Armatimonadota bacterium]